MEKIFTLSKYSIITKLEADYACENVCGCQGCNNITCVY